MENDPTRINKGLMLVIKLTSIIVLPMMCLISINANFIILGIFGEKWEEAIPIIQILCYAGAIQAISSMCSVVFNSIGKPEYGIYLSLLRTFLLSSSIIISYKSGLIITCYYILLAKIISAIILFLILRKLIQLKFIDLWTYQKNALINVILLIIINYNILTSIDIVISPLIKMLVLSFLSICHLLISEYEFIRWLVLKLYNKNTIKKVSSN